MHRNLPYECGTNSPAFSLVVGESTVRANLSRDFRLGTTPRPLIASMADPAVMNDPDGSVELGKVVKTQSSNRRDKPTHTHHCESLLDLQSALQAHVQATSSSIIPELMHHQFTFGNGTVFVIETDSPSGTSTTARTQTTVAEAIAASADAEEEYRRQSHVARHILDRIQRTDGYSYFERQAWDATRLGGYRFKSLCKDSLQNRDRVANGLDYVKQKPNGCPTDQVNGTDDAKADARRKLWRVIQCLTDGECRPFKTSHF